MPNVSIIQEDIRNIVSAFGRWDSFDDKTIFITGATGHIASWLTLSFAYAIKSGLIQSRLIVVARNVNKLHNLYAEFINDGWFEVIVADVCDSLDQEIKADYIFHFAGNASPYYISNDPVGILKANILGTFNVCEIARRSQHAKILYASTREVYGESTTELTLSETSFGTLDPLNPRSCYPESKRAAESILEAYHCQHSVNYDVIRIAHCYGPGMNLKNDGRVMSDLLNGAIQSNRIVLNSDGTALRAFCYISDAIIGILLIASKGMDAGVYNLSNEEEEISILNLAKKISSIYGNTDIEINAKPIDTSIYCNYKRVGLNCNRLYNLGWKPAVDLNSGLDKTIKFFRNE